MHFAAIFFGLQSKPRNYVIITLRSGFLQFGMKWFQFLGDRPEIVPSSSRISLRFFPPFLPHFTGRRGRTNGARSTKWSRPDLAVMFAKMKCRSCSCSLVKRTSVLKAVRNVCNTFRRENASLLYKKEKREVIPDEKGRWNEMALKSNV